MVIDLFYLEDPTLCTIFSKRLDPYILLTKVQWIYCLFSAANPAAATTLSV